MWKQQGGEFEANCTVYYMSLTPLTSLLADPLPYMQIHIYKQSPVG